MANRSGKGSEFERETCKLLSKWWSKGLTGEERDDIFWRSSQSGGRATQRAKFGKKTYGSYGDIAFTDPLGKPLLQLVTIELKRGSSIGCAGELVDTKASDCIRPFEAALLQAESGHDSAGSIGWLLICRRDHKMAMAYVDFVVVKQLREVDIQLAKPPCTRFDMMISDGDNWDKKRVRFLAVPLADFLARVSPPKIIDLLELAHEQT